MRCLVVWAHPDVTSYNAALCQAAVTALRERGHDVTLLDLYRSGFDPVLSPTEKASYLPRTHENIAALQGHVDALKSAEALIVVYPTWMYGPPAILKGWLDRVMLPGVAFKVGAGPHRPITGCLDHIRCFVGTPPLARHGGGCALWATQAAACSCAACARCSPGVAKAAGCNCTA